ncbi:sigma-54 dependent transcriptional regulator [Chryseolinea sp. T2]|uniref:sigma-54-dependent transcriptional regulator n=1 Tax=Chryseolinea sp. T2 TaxID=3129255 RepID=UPI003077E56F
MRRLERKIIVVEDEFIVSEDLRLIVEKAGYTVPGTAESVEEAERLIEFHRPGIVLLDINLKGPLTGIDLAIQLNARSIPFIYISAYCTQSILEEANKTNPYGFLVKPFRAADVRVALDIARYRYENSPDVDPPVAVQPADFDGIIGNDPGLLRVLDQAKRVAPYDTSVLLLGETGTGKERLALSIHRGSARSKGPLVKVNCAALPVDLIESELFGHERGAFSGAVSSRVGKFEQANGGTIFLDEIGELPLAAQTKLLRVLQEKEIDPLGSTVTKSVDVRIIAATNRNLELEVGEGRFKLDLFYRLNVFPLIVPPLRERKSDIEQLAVFFARTLCKTHNRKFEGIHGDMMAMLLAHDWPGNIRELENLIEQTVVLHDNRGMLNLGNASNLRRDFNATKAPAGPRTLEDVKAIQRMTERDYIISVLKSSGGRIRGEQGAAHILKLAPTTLESKIARLGISKQEYLS